MILYRSVTGPFDGVCRYRHQVVPSSSAIVSAIRLTWPGLPAPILMLRSFTTAATTMLMANSSPWQVGTSFPSYFPVGCQPFYPFGYQFGYHLSTSFKRPFEAWDWTVSYTSKSLQFLEPISLQRSDWVTSPPPPFRRWFKSIKNEG